MRCAHASRVVSLRFVVLVVFYVSTGLAGLGKNYEQRPVDIGSKVVACLASIAGPPLRFSSSTFCFPSAREDTRRCPNTLLDAACTIRGTEEVVELQGLLELTSSLPVHLLLEAGSRILPLCGTCICMFIYILRSIAFGGVFLVRAPPSLLWRESSCVSPQSTTAVRPAAGKQQKKNYFSGASSAPTHIAFVSSPTPYCSIESSLDLTASPRLNSFIYYAAKKKHTTVNPSSLPRKRWMQVSNRGFINGCSFLKGVN